MKRIKIKSRTYYYCNTEDQYYNKWGADINKIYTKYATLRQKL